MRSRDADVAVGARRPSGRRGRAAPLMGRHRTLQPARVGGEVLVSVEYVATDEVSVRVVRLFGLTTHYYEYF